MRKLVFSDLDRIVSWLKYKHNSIYEHYYYEQAFEKQAKCGISTVVINGPEILEADLGNNILQRCCVKKNKITKTRFGLTKYFVPANLFPVSLITVADLHYKSAQG